MRLSKSVQKRDSILDLIDSLESVADSILYDYYYHEFVTWGFIEKHKTKIEKSRDDIWFIYRKITNLTNSLGGWIMSRKYIEEERIESILSDFKVHEMSDFYLYIPHKAWRKIYKYKTKQEDFYLIENKLDIMENYMKKDETPEDIIELNDKFEYEALKAKYPVTSKLVGIIRDPSNGQLMLDIPENLN